MTSAARTFAAIATGRAPAGTPARLGHAVVLGGGMAGLLAARVLADHAETVVVLERDTVTGVPGPRRGVPQGSQVHALLRGGAVQLERWFPGFAARAVAAGALMTTAEQRRVYADGVLKARASDAEVLLATRPFLEHRVREHLREHPNVTTVTGRATGLAIDDTAVTGVHDETGGHHPADLVVDATGRAGRVADWLTAAGWDAPPMVRQVTGINYATALFRRPPGDHDVLGALALLAPRTGGDLAGATFSAVEDDRWIVMMGGYGECRPGATAADLIRRCRRDFPEPFGRVVSNELIGDVVTYRQADSRRRDWAKAARLPARLLAVGDAAASVNPIYGQGMSSAALHASCLSMFLHSGAGLDTSARGFFDLQQVVVDAAWAISTGGDRERPSIARPARGLDRLAAGLIGAVVDATVVDPVVGRVFDDVAHMVAHPAALARPGIVWRSLRARRTARPQPAAPLDPDQ